MSDNRDYSKDYTIPFNISEHINKTYFMTKAIILIN